MSLSVLSPALEQRTRCVDRTAGLVVEAVVPLRESSKRTKADFDGATGTGFTTLVEGGARLSGALGALVSQADHDDYLENLNPPTLTAHPFSGQFQAVMIRWAGTESPYTVLHRIKAHLHPRVNGANPQEVARWRARLYAVGPVTGFKNLPIALVLGLVPISDYVDVTAAGTEGEITFDFRGAGSGPWERMPVLPKLIKPWGTNSRTNLGTYQVPVTILVIQGLTAVGAPAGNIGLGIDTTQDTEPPSGLGNRLSTRLFTMSLFRGAGTVEDDGTAGGAPDLSVETSSFVGATLTFEDAGNRLDLGAVPAQTVEFIAKAEVPPGTAVSFEVRNDADTAWVEFHDGDRNTDLVGVGKNQTYKVRVNLAPDAGGDVTPTVREVGVREITRVSLADLVTIEGGARAINPQTLRGEISEAVITGIRDGERDYHDAITSLLAEHEVQDLTFEVWWGDPALARADWLHVDTFVLDDYEPQADAIAVTAVSPLSQLRQAFPVPQFLSTSGASLTFVPFNGPTQPARITRAAGSFLDDGYQGGDILTIAGSASNDKTVVLASVAATTLELDLEDDLVSEGPTSAPTLTAAVRRPYSQASISLKDAYDDLLDSQLGVPARYRGPGVEDDTTIGNTITDSDAKRELDAIAGIAGGGVITARGRITFRSLFVETAVAAVFPSEEIRMLRTSPGLRYRVPELKINYNWDETEGRFRSQVQALNQTGVDQLGQAYIEPKEAPDEMGRWIRSTTLAQTIGDRAVRYLGTGLMEWKFESTYPYPELLPGHLVAVETDQFVARDPFTAAALRGRLWALAVIVAVEDLAGTRFTVWIRQFADLLPAYTTLDLNPLLGLRVEAYFTPLRGSPGQVQVRLVSVFGATIKYVVQDLEAAVPAAGDVAYLTYTGPFNVTQLEVVDRQLSYYAERNGVRSPIRTVRVDKDTEPEVTLSIIQFDATNVQPQWVADDDVVFVRLYRKKNGAGNGWPALNNNVDGILDEAQLVGTLWVREDAGSFARAGTPLANVVDLTGTLRTGIGGTKWREGGYTTNDVVKCLVVPFDRYGNAGARASAALTVAGGAGAALTAFSAAMTAAGTSCSSKAQITISWTPNGSVSNGTHDLRLYRRRNGGSWIQLTAEVNPATVTTRVDTVDDFEEVGSQVTYRYEYKYELVDGVPTVLDQGQSQVVSIEVSGDCPVPEE